MLYFLYVNFIRYATQSIYYIVTFFWHMINVNIKSVILSSLVIFFPYKRIFYFRKNLKTFCPICLTKNYQNAVNRKQPELVKLFFILI